MAANPTQKRRKKRWIPYYLLTTASGGFLADVFDLGTWAEFCSGGKWRYAYESLKSYDRCFLQAQSHIKSLQIIVN